MNILVLNAGSSSLKFSLFKIEEGSGAEHREQRLANGRLERIGTPEAHLQVSVGANPPEERPVDARTINHAAEQAINLLTGSEASPSGAGSPHASVAGRPLRAIDAVGHRIVHGGDRFYQPVRVDAQVQQAIRDLFELAPLHNPAGLAGIEAGMKLLPHAPAVAVFDTAFHHDLPPTAARYALPDELKSRFPLRRYGFHGISYRYVSGRLLQCLEREAAGTRLVICHLGNGASICALRDGRSVDTSMGFTPLEGLIMGSRSGDVDPGLLLYLIRAGGYDAERLEDLLNHRSGLRGLSGRSGDLRDLERAAADADERAEQALEAFAYRVRKYIGAYAAALGGLDALAFTGGIGEHSTWTRARICRGLEFLGLRIDPERNAVQTDDAPHIVSAPDSVPPIWVIPTDEERQIARETYTLAAGSGQ